MRVKASRRRPVSKKPKMKKQRRTKKMLRTKKMRRGGALTAPQRAMLVRNLSKVIRALMAGRALSAAFSNISKDVKDALRTIFGGLKDTAVGGVRLANSTVLKPLLIILQDLYTWGAGPRAAEVASHVALPLGIATTGHALRFNVSQAVGALRDRSVQFSQTCQTRAGELFARLQALGANFRDLPGVQSCVDINAYVDRVLQAILGPIVDILDGAGDAAINGAIEVLLRIQIEDRDPPDGASTVSSDYTSAVSNVDTSSVNSSSSPESSISDILIDALDADGSPDRDWDRQTVESGFEFGDGAAASQLSDLSRASSFPGQESQEREPGGGPSPRGAAARETAMEAARKRDDAARQARRESRGVGWDRPDR